MKHLALLLGLIASACVTDKPGKMGQQGAPGPTGPPGPGEGLIWKDASGAVVDSAFPTFANHAFQMLVIANDVTFEVNPLSGLLIYASIDSTTFWHYYLTTNCTGDIYIDSTPLTPGVAFKYNSRIVALPPDVPVLTQMGSYYAGATCYHGPGMTGFVKLDALEALPTLAPPLLGPGPYHVDRI